MAIDWDAVEKATGSNYKNYAANGVHKVKLADVELREIGTKGNWVAELKFEETADTQYQTASYYLSKEKTNWRIHSMKNLLTVLSGSEENAKKVCELAESKNDFDYAVKGYEKGLKALAAKHPEVEIEVYFSGKYSQKGTPISYATLTDPRCYNKQVKEENPMAGAEEVSLDNNDVFGDIPF